MLDAQRADWSISRTPANPTPSHFSPTIRTVPQVLPNSRVQSKCLQWHPHLRRAHPPAPLAPGQFRRTFRRPGLVARFRLGSPRAPSHVGFRTAGAGRLGRLRRRPPSRRPRRPALCHSPPPPRPPFLSLAPPPRPSAPGCRCRFSRSLDHLQAHAARAHGSGTRCSPPPRSSTSPASTRGADCPRCCPHSFRKNSSSACSLPPDALFQPGPAPSCHNRPCFGRCSSQ